MSPENPQFEARVLNIPPDPIAIDAGPIAAQIREAFGMNLDTSPSYAQNVPAPELGAEARLKIAAIIVDPQARVLQEATEPSAANDDVEARVLEEVIEPSTTGGGETNGLSDYGQNPFISADALVAEAA